jgi:hypothetical protein
MDKKQYSKSELLKDIVKTKWLPRHLLNLYISIPFFRVNTSLMSYSFESLAYHWIRLDVKLFKWEFGFDIGREEKREIAHKAYKRMTNETMYWSDNTVPCPPPIDTRSLSSIETKKQWWKNVVGCK